VKMRIRSARTAAARTINRELILLYWDIGRGIVEKQQQLGWGKSVVERLSGDLKSEFPETTGLSADNLWRIRQFFSEHSSEKFLEQTVPENANIDGREILEQPVPELLLNVPWGHHVEVMKKVKAQTNWERQLA